MAGRSFVAGVASSTLRLARRSPGFALAVTATLGLGIGANTAIFGIVDRVLLRPPLHVVDADRVMFVGTERGDRRFGTAMTFPDYRDLLGASAFEHVSPVSVSRHTMRLGDGAVPLEVVEVSPSFFPLLGVTPVVGRFFGPNEEGVGADPTVVLSEEFWATAFGSDPAVIGRVVDVSGVGATVIGIVPAGFTGVGLLAVDAWMPIVATRSRIAELSATRPVSDLFESRGAYWISVVARLSEGVSPEAAADEATGLHRAGRASQIAQGRYSEEVRIALRPLTSPAGAESHAAVVRWLAGVSLLVLLVACANVANLLLARSVRVRRDTAVRLALGASQARLAAERLGSAVILAGMGGAAAVVLALWGQDALQRIVLPGVYFPGYGATGRVLLFALVISVISGLLAAVAPTLRAARTSVAGALREGARGTSTRSRMQAALAAAQAALSLVLLVGAGLFVKSLDQVDRVDLGFDVDRLLLVTLDNEPSVQTPDDVNGLYVEAASVAARLPEVESAAVTTAPFYWSWAISISVPGFDSLPRMPGGGPYVWGVGLRYFETAGVPLLKGRDFEQADLTDGRRVAIVGRAMADSLWGGSALGQCLLVGDDPGGCTTVVGVAENTARAGLEDEPFFQYYLPYEDVRTEGMEVSGIYVRVTTPAASAASIATALRSFSPRVRHASVRPLEDVLDPLSRTWKLGATMFSLFGVLALTIAAVGLYSLLSFNVAQRRRELGIRAALGADRTRLLIATVSEALRLTLLGVSVGTALTLMAGPGLQDLLFRVSPRDPVVLVGVAVTLLAVSACASLLPAHRATRVDPAEALRTE